MDLFCLELGTDFCNKGILINIMLFVLHYIRNENTVPFSVICLLIKLVKLITLGISFQSTRVGCTNTFHCLNIWICKNPLVICSVSSPNIDN
jgi:hypothetical protein